MGKIVRVNAIGNAIVGVRDYPFRWIVDSRKFFEIYKLLFTVHDDINFATQNLRKVRYIKECVEAPVPGMPLRVPIWWDADVGPNWAVNYREKSLRKAA